MFVRHAYLRSDITRRTFTQITPEWKGAWKAAECLEEDFRDCLAELSEFLDGIPPRTSALYETSLLRQILRIQEWSFDPSLRMPELHRERADLVQMQRDLARFAVTTHDFVDRTAAGWFGNINYFEGGYFCCDADAIKRHIEPLHSRLVINERPLGCAEGFLAWLMLVVVHPFLDGNGRFARCFSARLPTAPENRVLLGEFWMDYVHQVSPVLATAHAAIEKGSIAELVQMAVSNARRHIESRKVTCARLCLLQRRMPSIASHICMGGVFSVKTVARAIGRSDRVTLATMSSLVDVGVLSKDEAGSELTYRFRGLEHPIAHPILIGAEPRARVSGFDTGSVRMYQQ